MKKTIIPFLLFFLFAAFAGQAQDSKITTGVVNFQQGRYEEAIKAFNVGLKDPSMCKAKNIPKGYYYRGMSRMKFMQQIAQSGKVEENKDKLDGILVKAYEDFKKAKETDDGKWGSKVDQQLNMLGQSILQAGLMILNGADKLSAAEKKEAYQEAIKYLDIAVEINPDNYIAYDLRAQVELAVGDSVKAHSDFSTAAKKFESNEPKRPDQLIAYVYYRKALLERYIYAMRDIDAALASLEKGKEMLEKERKRLLANKEKYPAEAWTKLEEQYIGASGDLGNFELDMLLNSPDKLQEAIGKFEKAVQADPNNYIKHVAFAQLLERTDLDRAAEVYLAATKIEPKKHIAWFNLGALYVNQGVALYKQANEIEDDYEKAKSLQAQGDELYRKALPLLEKAQEIEPCDKETLQALLNITINLGASDESMTAKYKKYKDAKKNCGQ